MQIRSQSEGAWPQAQAQFREGNFRTALATCETILAQDPQHSGAHLLLAELALRAGKRQLATRGVLAAASGMSHQPIEHVVSVVRLLVTLGEYEEAATLVARVDVAAVRSPAELAELARLLGVLELHAEALRFLDGAIKCGFNSDSVNYLRGNCLKFLGRMDEAADAYEESLRSNPVFGKSHVAIADLGLAENSARNIDRIRGVMQPLAADHGDLAHLNFALFKELDRVGPTPAAWQALESGCRLRRRAVTHDAVGETATFDRMIQATSSGFCGTPSLAGNSRTPIFIVGLPRSGTTLLERILGNHDHIHPCGELNDFRMQLRWSTDHGFRGLIDDLSIVRLGGVDAAELGHRYLGHVAWRNPSASFFTDKKPGNFMLAGMILRALPHAKVIHIARDPMDSCFSNFKELFGVSAHAYSYDFAELTNHYRNYSRLMAHWHQIAPGRILDVSYEELAARPEQTARAVMAYCGLPFQPAQVRVEDNSAPVSTASSVQVRQAINTRNIGAWKRYANQMEPLRQMIGAQ